MARMSALARPDQSEGRENRATHQRTGAPPKYPPKQTGEFLQGLYNSGPSGSTEPRERSEYLSQGLPHIKIYWYLYVQHIPPQTLLLGVVASPVGHPAYCSTRLKIKCETRVEHCGVAALCCETLQWNSHCLKTFP